MSAIITARPVAKAMALLAAFGVAGAASGCFRAQARAVPEMPALDAPAPPPRLVETVDRPPLEASPVSPVLPDGTAPRVEPTKPADATSPRPQPAASEAGPVPEEGPAAPPATVLQTTPPGGEVELERAIRGLMTRAAANLNNIDYQRLHPDAQAQYDQAKRFISQAEEAIVSKNFPFAHNLADKAATLATQLAGR